MRQSLRNNFLAGILVLIPIAAVFWIVAWLWHVFFSITRLLPDSFHPRSIFNLENVFVISIFDVLMTFLIVGLIVLFIWIVGLISRNYLGTKFLAWISLAVGRVPVLSTVYSTLEQLLKTFASTKANNFRRVVYFEYPRKGIFTLALVTGERDSHPLGTELYGAQRKFVNVFVPTTPNPTSGFYLSIPVDEVREANITVEEALKEIISMGIVYAERRKG